MHAWFAAVADTRYSVVVPIIGVQVNYIFGIIYVLNYTCILINKGLEKDDCLCYVLVGISMGHSKW